MLNIIYGNVVSMAKINSQRQFADFAKDIFCSGLEMQNYLALSKKKFNLKKKSGSKCV
jgi:hypothetical protein